MSEMEEGRHPTKGEARAEEEMDRMQSKAEAIAEAQGKGRSEEMIPKVTLSSPPNVLSGQSGDDDEISGEAPRVKVDYLSEKVQWAHYDYAKILKLEAERTTAYERIAEYLQEIVNEAGLVAHDRQVRDIIFETPYGDLRLLFTVDYSDATLLEVPPAFRPILPGLSEEGL